MIITKEEINRFINDYQVFTSSESINAYSIRGLYHLNKSFKGVELEDYFDIEIVISKTNDENPIVFEHNRIQKFHHKFTDNSLCLEIPMKIKIDTKKFKYNLSSFFEVYVVPYLYGYVFYEIYGYLPFGERSHGVDGYIEYFKEAFDLKTPISVHQFIQYLSNNDEYRGHHNCPCGSGKNIRNCHKDVLFHYFNEKNEVVLSFIKEYLKGYKNVKSKNK